LARTETTQLEEEVSHSPEPWKVSTRDCVLNCVERSATDAKDQIMAWFADADDARRVVACVNACFNWTTEELEGFAFLKTGAHSGDGRPVAHLAAIVKCK
jgi:hypothetical protein